MNILKTPTYMAKEDAGLVPASPGMLKTPQQLLMEESGALPKVFADGGQVAQMNPEMLRALIEAYRQYLNTQPAAKEPINQVAAEPATMPKAPQPPQEPVGGLATLTSAKPAKKATRKTSKKIKK